MTPVHRWKLVSALLAGWISYTWWAGDVPGHGAPSAAHARVKGPLRASAAALGISTDELVRQLFAAKELADVRTLAERLGIVGDDDVIDAVMPLVQDPREGVPEAIVGAFGAIASEHAVDVLIKTAADPRDPVRVAAVEALGATHSSRAEPMIVEVAQRNEDAAQNAAIYALGDIGSEPSIAVLAKLANHPTETAANAVRALARIESPSAKAALRALVDSPSLAVAAAAIAELKDINDDMVAKLTSIVAAGEPELFGTALGALARAGESGMPPLRAAALDGPIEVRVAAINAMMDVDHPQVLVTLRTILETEDGRVADAAANALANINRDEAREALISAALSEQAGTTRAVQYLMRQTGPDVEAALLVIAKSDSKERWDVIVRLVRDGNAEALALAVAQSRGGSDDTVKLAAMEALAHATSQPALDALIEVVRGSAELKPRALAVLGSARPDDPVVGKLLHDSVQSTNVDEAAAAAAALSRVGTPEARDALIAALRSSDAEVARTAATSLATFRLTDDVTSAMRAAIVAHPELKLQVMQQMVSSGSPLGIELATQVLEGGASHEAYRAISALERAASPAAFDVLARSARIADPEIRAEVVSSLGNTGDKRASEVLAQAMRDSDASVRSAATRTLGNLGTTQARDLVVTMSRSANAGDRREAASTLRRFDDPNSTRRLIELIRDSDGAVASVAIDAAADRPDAVSALRSVAGDGNVSYGLRREAAQALSYRGVSDPMITELLTTSADY